MRETAGRTFSIAKEHPATPGCTTSFAVHEGAGLAVSYFSLAAGTDISAETHPQHKLLVVADGSMDVDAGDGARHVAGASPSWCPRAPRWAWPRRKAARTRNSTWKGKPS